MQQLNIVHKKEVKSTTNNNYQKQVVSSEPKQELDLENKRESKGRVLAISRRTYRLQYSDVYYVESESRDNVYYYVKFKPDVFEWCSCKDNSTRHATTTTTKKKCKHLFAIEFAIRMNTLKDISRLPSDAKRYNGSTTVVEVTTPTSIQTKSYKDDDYSF